MTPLRVFTPQDPELTRLLPHLQAAIASQPVAKLSSVSDVAIDPLENGQMVRMVGASAYAEKGEARWFVQWVAKSNPDGAKLHVEGADTSVVMKEGDILVFDAGKAHWVETESLDTSDTRVSVLIGTRALHPPTDQQAEAILLDYLRVNFPKVCGAGLAAKPPRP